MTRNARTVSSRRARAVIAAAAAAVLATVGVAATVTTAPAVAATSTSWSTWTVAGSGGAFTGTADVDATGFPAATWTSDSRAPVGVPTGASTWLPPGSPVGQVYGSSQGRPYLLLRPRVDAPGSPSSTVLTFDAPTPAAGWAVVLGDVDSDLVVVSGTRVDGLPATPAELGVEGAFSFCDASPRPSACSGTSAPYDLPTWTQDADAVVLTGNGPDTTGAAGWLQPQVALTSLTLQVEQLAGFPVVDVWLVALTRSASGLVTLDGEPAPGREVEVLAPDGTVVATATTGPDGTWSVPDLVASQEWRARVVPPDGTTTDGPGTRDVDVSSADAVDVDFTLVTSVPDPDPTLEPTVEPSTEPTSDPTGPGSPAPGATESPSPAPTGTGASPTVTGASPTVPGTTGAPGETGGPTGTDPVGRALARTGVTGLLGAVVLGLSLVGAGVLLLGTGRGSRQR